MNYKELTKKLRALAGRGTVIPDRGNRDLKKGTTRGILKQLGIDRDDLEKTQS